MYYVGWNVFYYELWYFSDHAPRKYIASARNYCRASQAKFKVALRFVFYASKALS